MTRVPILEWDALGEAIGVNDSAASIGSQLFRILEGAGYTAADIATVARTLYAYVDHVD